MATSESWKDRYTAEVTLWPYRGELTMLDSRQDGFPREERSNHPDPGSYMPGYDDPPSASGSTTGAPGFDDEIPF